MPFVSTSLRRALPSACCIIALLSHSTNSMAMDASTKEAVRSLANDGAVDFDAGRYEAARDKFERAYSSAQVPTLALLLGQCDVKLGRLVSALESFRQATILAPNELWVGDTQQRAQAQAQTEIDQLTVRIARLRINVEGAPLNSLSLTVDGTAIPSALLKEVRPVDPGVHVVIGTSNGQTVREEVRLSEAEHKELTLRFTAPVVTTPNQQNSQKNLQAAPTPNSQPNSPTTGRTIAWVGVAVASAATAVGLTTGALGLLKYGSLKDDCPNKRCGPAHWSEVDSYDTMRNVSKYCLIGGLVTGAASVTFLLSTPSSNRTGRLELLTTPTFASVRGSF